MLLYKKFIRGLSFIALILITHSISNAQSDWAYSIGGQGIQRVIAMTVDSDESVITVGHFNDIVNIDPNNSMLQIVPNGGFDCIMQKTDSVGNILWTKAWGGSYFDVAWAVKTDSLDNIFVSGTIVDTVDMDPGIGINEVIPYSYSALSAIFISKFDSDGNFIWTKIVNGPGGVSGGLFTFDEQGSIYLSSSYSDSIDFDPGINTYYDNNFGNSEEGAFILKLDSMGQFQWVRKLYYDSSTTGQGSISYSSGAIYYGGSFTSSLQFTDSISDILSNDPGGSPDSYLAKYDTLGNLLWINHYSSSDIFEQMAIRNTLADDVGNVYISGSFGASVDFNSSNPSLTINNLSQNYDNHFLAKIDQSGSAVWVRQFSGGSIRLLDINANTIFIGGVNWCLTSDSVFQHGTSGAFESLPLDSCGYILMEYDTSGVHQWTETLPTSNIYSNDNISDGVKTSNGTIYTCGNFISPIDVSINGPSNILSSVDFVDFFVAKFDGCFLTDPVVNNQNNTLSINALNGNCQWIDCTTQSPILGATNNQFTPLINGEYAVIFENGGCIDTSECYSVSTIGVSENDSIKIQIYPNPVKNYVAVSTDKPFVLTLTNALGEIILTTNKKHFSVDHLSAGNYYVVIQFVHTISHHKLVKI